jgi:hypothetical protein
MVSIKYFSGEAALSCRNVIPDVVATSVKVTGLVGSGADHASGLTVSPKPIEPMPFSRSRLEM